MDQSGPFFEQLRLCCRVTSWNHIEAHARQCQALHQRVWLPKAMQSSTLHCKDNRFQACTAYLWQPTWHAACYFRFLPAIICIAHQIAILSAVTSNMGKHYSAYCFARSATRPLYGLSELAGCMNRKSVMEVILLRESFLM